MRKDFLAGVCATVAMFVAAPAWAADESATPDRPPNIVILQADDLGYADVGFQGVKDIPTPNIDAVAAQGVRFTHAYVTGPMCVPTRAGLVTGRYQNRFDSQRNRGNQPSEPANRPRNGPRSDRPGPLHATEDRLQRFASIESQARRTCAAMLTAVDEAVGQVQGKLRASGLEDNTLIFFLADNGAPVMPTTTINGSRNDPFRGSKRTTLEGGIRVPFAIQWKNRLPAGKVYERPIIQLDVLPTALAAAGVAISPEWKLDGVNLLPYLEGQEQGTPHETLYWRFGQQRAIRKGDWKLVQYDTNADESTPETRAASGGGTPIISPPKLYNLAEDPGESKDLAAEKPEKFQELETAWQAWNAEVAGSP